MGWGWTGQVPKLQLFLEEPWQLPPNWAGTSTFLVCIPAPHVLLQELHGPHLQSIGQFPKLQFRLEEPWQLFPPN